MSCENCTEYYISSRGVCFGKYLVLIHAAASSEVAAAEVGDAVIVEAAADAAAVDDELVDES